MEGFIHRALVAHIIISPFLLVLFAFGLYSQSVQLGQVRSELAWANLNAKADEAFRK